MIISHYMILITGLLLICCIGISGCIGEETTIPCVPVHVDKVYPVAWDVVEGGYVVKHYGIAIIDGRGYFIDDKEAFEAMSDNITVNIAIGTSNIPQYIYIYRVCK